MAAPCARLAVLAHVPLDVLDDDDRVVDDDAGGEHDAEQRQRVDREAEQLHERERADERDRNRDRRDERAAPVLQEEEHHEHDEDDRLGERLQHFDDRLADDADVVERDLRLEPGREALLEALQLRLDAREDLERVGRRQQLDADARRLDAAEPQVATSSSRRRARRGRRRCTRTSAPSRAGLDDDVLELGDLGQPAHRRAR